MARPISQGLTYFPFDTNIFSDRKIRRLLRTFGTKGFTIYVYLLCEIYRDKGYYMMWDNDVAFDVSEAISGTSEELVTNVVTQCVEWGLFDEKIFNECHVLTGSGIQKRFKEVTKRRVVDVDNFVIPATKTDIPVTKTKNTETETPKNVTDGTQSKEKKSKEKIKESKVKEEIIDFFNKTCVSLPSVKLTPKRKSNINARIREHSVDEVYEMIKKASESSFLAGQNKRDWQATFDWLFRPNNFVKVLEGNYADKEKKVIENSWKGNVLT
jgi:hypothetical protein